jgi:hypothetical protein
MVNPKMKGGGVNSSQEPWTSAQISISMVVEIADALKPNLMPGQKSKTNPNERMSIMKKILLLFLVLLVGCSWDQVVQDQWGLLAIKNAARGLGYSVANSKTTLDETAIEESYNLLKTGQADPAIINEALAHWNLQPGGKLLVLAALDLLGAMGAVITDKTIVDLSAIPPELWLIVESSYSQGFELGKIDRGLGVTRMVP